MFKLNPLILVFQLLAVPILATFLDLLLLPPRDLGTLFSCSVLGGCDLWTFLGVPRRLSNRQPSPISLRSLVQRRASDDPALNRISDGQLA